MDAPMIIQGLIGALGVVLWFLYKEQKTKTDALHTDLLTHKIHVAEKYVTNDQLTRTIENIGNTIETVASGVLRIENRLNQQIDNRNNHQP